MKEIKNKIKTVILILLMLSIVSLSGCSEIVELEVTDHLKEKYSITFFVKDMETDRPLHEAGVGGDVIYYTDFNGRVTITDIEEGTYTFFVDKGKNLVPYDPVFQQITLNHNIQINIALSIAVSTCEIVEID